MSKKHLFVAILVVAITAFSFFFDVRIFYNFDVEPAREIPSASDLLKREHIPHFACDVQGNVLEHLEMYRNASDANCYVRVLEANYFSGNQEIDTYLSRSLFGGGELMSRELVKITTLWFLMPRSFAGGSDVNFGNYYEYVKRLTLESDSREVLVRAIEVLSYYKNNDDVDIFLTNAMRGDGEVMEKSIAALLSLCTPESIAAINRVFQERRVVLDSDEYAWLKKYVFESAHCAISHE